MNHSKSKASIPATKKLTSFVLDILVLDIKLNSCPPDMSLKKHARCFLLFRELHTRVHVFPSMNPLPPIIQNNTKWKNHILKIIDIKDFVVNTPPTIQTNSPHFSQPKVM